MLGHYRGVGHSTIQANVCKAGVQLLAKRVLLFQALIGIIAVTVAFPFGNYVVVSVLIGAVTCLIANSLLAFTVFWGYTASKSQRLLLRIYGGEVVKIAIISLIFVLAFVSIHRLNVPALLVAYLLTQVASTVIAAQFKPRSETRQVPKARIER